MTSVNDFIQNFNIGGRANLYQVEIIGVDGIDEKVKYHCKGAQVPGKTVSPIEVRYLSHIIKVAGDPIFDDWTATIQHDEDHEIRTGLDDWQQKIMANDDAIGEDDLNNYFKQIKISQLKRNGDVNADGIYTLHNAWPTTIDPMDLGFDNTDTILEYGVTFAYTHWVKG